MPTARFETAVPPSERLQIDALDRAGTGIITSLIYTGIFSDISSTFSYDARTPAQQQRFAVIATDDYNGDEGEVDILKTRCLL